MPDLILELLRFAPVGLILIILIRIGHSGELHTIQGWSYILAGFAFIFFGTLIDITDNFESLKRFIILGDTPIQAFLEKVVGYLLGYVFVFVGIWKWLPKLIEHQKMTNDKLENTQEELKVLQGLLPICASCKNIRDDKGYWQQIEGYIGDHSDATFSHSICPECMEKLYPDEFESLKTEDAKHQALTAERTTFYNSRSSDS